MGITAYCDSYFSRTTKVTLCLKIEMVGMMIAVRLDNGLA